MTTKTTKAIGRLARDICYNGFASRKDVGCSKTEYWKRLSPEKQAEYVREASWFCYTVKRMGRANIEKIFAGNLE